MNHIRALSHGHKEGEGGKQGIETDRGDDSCSRDVPW
jgi:hypothetical protein